MSFGMTAALRVGRGEPHWCARFMPPHTQHAGSSKQILLRYAGIAPPYGWLPADPFHARRRRLAQILFDEFAQEVAHGFASAGQRKIARGNDRARQVDRRFDQDRLGEIVARNVREVALRQNRIADAAPDRREDVGQTPPPSRHSVRRFAVAKARSRTVRVIFGAARQDQRRDRLSVCKRHGRALRSRLPADQIKPLPEERFAGKGDNKLVLEHHRKIERICLDP